MGHINRNRESNQFNSLINGKNLATVPQSMKEKHQQEILSNFNAETVLEPISHRIGGLYQGTNKEEIKPGMSEGVINYEGKPYTVVYPSGILHGFESTNTKVTYLLPDVKIERRMSPELLQSMWMEITPQLKALFDGISGSSELMNEANRHKIDGRKLFTMADNLRQNLHLPYIGGQLSSGEFVGRPDEYDDGRSVMMYLPICVDGKFVKIVVDEDTKSAKFRLYEAIDAAHPLAYFTQI